MPDYTLPFAHVDEPSLADARLVRIEATLDEVNAKLDAINLAVMKTMDLFDQVVPQIAPMIESVFDSPVFKMLTKKPRKVIKDAA